MHVQSFAPVRLSWRLWSCGWRELPCRSQGSSAIIVSTELIGAPHVPRYFSFAFHSRCGSVRGVLVRLGNRILERTEGAQP